MGAHLGMRMRRVCQEVSDGVPRAHALKVTQPEWLNKCPAGVSAGRVLKSSPSCVQALSGPHQMCDMKTELTQEKDACEAQLENKTAGRYVVCVCSASLLPASPSFA